MYWEYRNYSLYSTYCGGVAMEIKFCNKCKTLKNIDEFYKRGNGHCSHCKECMKENNTFIENFYQIVYYKYERRINTWKKLK